MIVLHSFWDGRDSLHLWAESSAPTPSTSRQRGRTAKVRPHPFAIAGGPHEKAFAAFSGGALGRSMPLAEMTVLLPSRPGEPLPSPELPKGEETGDQDKIVLKSWRVNTLALGPDAAPDLLTSLDAEAPEGVVLGSSLRFWAEAAKLSLEMVSRQCFIPALKEEKSGNKRALISAWEVFFSEGDSRRVQLLADSMPPSCRDFLPPEEGSALSAYDLVSSFLNRTSDAFVRRSLSAKPLLPPHRGSRDAPLPERWLRALFSEDPRLEATAVESASFSEDLKAWLSQAQPIPSDTPFRTCFRLDSPDDDSQGWKVSFHLQASDDRSLLVPAEKVWGTRSGVITFLKRRFENPQERLLADLGKASRVFPAIDDSLKTARPAAVQLGTEQAYSFLRQSAPLLEQSGFGVLLPPWWQKPAARLSARLKLRPKTNGKTASGLFGMDSIVAYDWQIALGDERLSPEEFQKLAELKTPLVRVRGQWVELRPEEIEAAIAFFQKKYGGEMRLDEALRIGLGREMPGAGLPVAGVEAQGWVGDFLDKAASGATVSEVLPPASFHGKLRPYQVKGLSWLAFLERFGLGACLADDMGLGKTIQLIALLLHERAGRGKKPGPSPTLLVCPMSVVGNWQKEVERFGPSLRILVHHGPDRPSGAAFQREAKRHDLIISTYALAQRDEEAFRKVRWERIALDEAQNIKNPAAKQTQAIKNISSNHRVALTGTPVENRLSELWSILDFLNPGYLRSAGDFRSSFAVPIEKYRNPERAETLKRLVQPFVLRRLKTDPSIISDLPEKLEVKAFCNLTREQATLYEAVVKEMLEKIKSSEGIERKGLVLSTLSQLKQVCNHPAQFLKDGSNLAGRSGKLTRLREMLEEILAEGDRALLFTQFAEMGVMLRQHLQEAFGREVLFLHGGTTKKQRDCMVQRFQSDHRGPPLFILSLKAGGLGLNLTAASHVFHFDRWWNPAVENQATDRAFRIGQKKNVQVHKFICLGTLEERIDQMIEQKKELAESIIGVGEGWLTEMSTDQLKQVFALSREAVREE
ncbi:MAG: DEAD/DEAH box helicase [Chloroflexi bacterium]|nr:DEAD/DEAH box helicase [Chloroflexota bacterium]